MRKISIILIILFTASLLFAGCGGKKTEKMYQSKNKNKQGLPNMGAQVDENDRGKQLIDLSGNLMYPGSESYEGQTYMYLSKDSTDTVVKYFEENLSGATVEKETLTSGEVMMQVFWKDIEIEVTPYESSGSLIQYKKKIK